MTRAEFIRSIEILKDHEQECREAGKALNVLAKDSHTPAITLGARLHMGYIELLEVAMGDTDADSWIRWWLYDAPKKNPSVYLDGEGYTINTPGQLYDMIRRWQKHNKQ